MKVIHIHEKATITPVCPVCPTQPWYAQLFQVVVDILLSITPGILTGPQGQEHPLVSNKNPLHCRLEGIRRIVVLAAQRTLTQNQYKPCWAKWVGWCNKQAVPIHPSIVKVVDFQSGLQYSTLNSYRSPISSTIPPVDASPVGLASTGGNANSLKGLLTCALPNQSTPTLRMLHW